MFLNSSVEKLLFKFAVPAIITLFVIELYNMVDTIYVGRAIGGNAIGALTVAFPVQRLITAIGMMIAVGSYTIVARALGENDPGRIKSVITNSILLTSAVMTVLITLILVFHRPIIRGLGASEAIFPYARDYINIVALGGFFQCITLVMCYIMTALGNTQITLKATLTGALINIIGDYILVVLLPLGVKGAAISTTLSQLISLAYAFYKFKDVKKDFKIGFSLKVEGNVVWDIIIVGVSTFIIEISDAVAAVILNNLLQSYGGDSAIIIVGVTTKVSMFLFITVIGISSAMQPVAAFNFGLGDMEKVREVLIKTIKLVTISTASVWLVMMLLPQYIIGFFITDKGLLKDTIAVFRIVISLFPLIGIYYVAIYYYQAMGEGKKSLLISIYRQILIFIPILVILVKNFGLIGVWIAYPVSDIISSITGALYIYKSSIFTREFKTYEIDYQ